MWLVDNLLKCFKKEKVFIKKMLLHESMQTSEGATIKDFARANDFHFMDQKFKQFSVILFLKMAFVSREAF